MQTDERSPLLGKGQPDNEGYQSTQPSNGRGDREGGGQGGAQGDRHDNGHGDGHGGAQGDRHDNGHGDGHGEQEPRLPSIVLLCLFLLGFLTVRLCPKHLPKSWWNCLKSSLRTDKDEDVVQGRSPTDGNGVRNQGPDRDVEQGPPPTDGNGVRNQVPGRDVHVELDAPTAEETGDRNQVQGLNITQGASTADENGVRNQVPDCKCGRKPVCLPKGVAVFFMAVVEVLLIIDFFKIIDMFMDEEENAVFVLWYFTNQLPMTIALTFCLFQQLSCFDDKNMNRSSVWSENYIKMRQGHSSEHPYRYFGLFVLTLPIVCVTLTIYLFVGEVGRTNCNDDVFSWLRFFGGVFGYFYYGVFCFVISFFRISHRKKFLAFAETVWKNDTENSKKATIQTLAIVELFEAFRSFRDFVGAWMVISISIGVLGLASMIPFTIHTLPKIKDPNNPAYEDTILELWTAFTWLNKILFLLWPTVAVGGWDAGRPWRYFREMILMKWTEEYESIPGTEEDKSKALDDILARIKQLSDKWVWLTSAIVLSAVTLFMAIEFFPEQDVNLWVILQCSPKNDTTFIRTG